MVLRLYTNDNDCHYHLHCKIVFLNYWQNKYAITVTATKCSEHSLNIKVEKGPLTISGDKEEHKYL
ncbi:Heat shock protein Hsp20 [Moritella viscosa]|nr:Heat shock protein Hsp20 [Moritella viscosa]SHN98474.1 Heat shock protein Hsp20 [Moritella viscosa]SHO24559.1 Heat shock protein Hsp20 [Moritella viscosa]